MVIYLAKGRKKDTIKKIQAVLKEFIKPQNYRHLVRIGGVDIEGDMPAIFGLTRIKGVSYSLANAILTIAGIDKQKLIGFLTDEEIQKIEEILSDPVSHGIPWWLVNRQRDPETGKNLHYIGSQLVLRTKKDIELMIKIKSWKGIRHALGLKVRGQRTRTTGRKGLTVGVQKKKK